MNQFLKYQMVVFGDFIGIDVRVPIVTKLIDGLQKYKFIQSTFSEQKLGTNIVSERIMLLSNEHNLEISIGVQRIDIVKTNKVTPQGAVLNSDLSLVYEELSEIAKEIMKTFSVKSNRLAWIISLNNQKKFDNDNFFNKLPFYNGDLYEWGLRVNKRVVEPISGYIEHLNVITKLDKVDNQELNPALTIDGCLYEIDINTAQENMVKRFSIKSIDDFTKVAKTIFGEIYDSIKD